MHGRIRRAVIFFLLTAMLLCGSMHTCAQDNTTYTYTISVNDGWVKTQDAYMPAAVYLRGAGLSQPGDLFFFRNQLYIADTGNSRIAVYSLADASVTFFGQGILKSPKGVFVANDGRIYVADSDAEAVFVFSPERKLVLTVGRPDNYLFSKTSMYKPRAVAVSSVGNIFVVGEGAYEGVMQFDSKGEFFGYFAANKYKMSATEQLQELVYTEKQKEQLLVRTPRPIENIDISSKDLIYSVTKSDDRVGYDFQVTSSGNTLKMHNMAGLNIFAANKSMKEEWNFVDTAAGSYGNVFALTFTGMINEYDSAGNVIFSFGGRASDCDRNGLFVNASAIDVDDETGFLYVLDQERAMVQVFYPTDFANMTHRAINALETGNYTDSESIWSELLRLNGLSRLAHIGYGKSLFYQQKYGDAMEHFKIANEISYYSEAKWEQRNSFLNRSMTVILLVLIALVLFGIGKGIWRRKHPAKKKIYSYAPEAWSLPRGKLFGKQLLFSRKMIAHPLDGMYYLRIGRTGSVWTATVLYLLTFAVYVYDCFGRGYIFRLFDPEFTSPVAVIIMFWVPLILWLAGNYMVGSINDGEGTLTNIYVATAYALTPYLFFTPLNVILSYGLTLNEGFVIRIAAVVIMAWSACLVFLSVMEMQRYTFGETVKNILLVLFFMIMVVVTVTIIYLLLSTMIDFFREIIGEGIYRVNN